MRYHILIIISCLLKLTRSQLQYGGLLIIPYEVDDVTIEYTVRYLFTTTDLSR